MNKISKIILKIILVLSVIVMLLKYFTIGWFIYDFLFKTDDSLEHYVNLYVQNQYDYNRDAAILFSLAKEDSVYFTIHGYETFLTIDTKVCNYQFVSNGVVVKTKEPLKLNDEQLSIIKKCDMKKYLKYFKYIYISKDYISFEGNGFYNRKLIYCPDGNLDYMRYIEKINDSWYCCYDD